MTIDYNTHSTKLVEGAGHSRSRSQAKHKSEIRAENSGTYHNRKDMNNTCMQQATI